MKATIIGAGRMGRRHVLAIRRQGLELASLCDRSTDALRAASEELQIADDRLHSDAAKSLAETKPEVVIIATTAPSHADLTLLAAESGARFILCEKPMATSLRDCDRMLAACHERNVHLAVNHPMRYMEQYKFPKRFLELASDGGLTGMNVIAGNFGIAMNGTHYFEAFRYLTGAPIRSVRASFSPEIQPNPRGPEFEDRAGTVFARDHRGSRLLLDASADQGHGLRVTYASRTSQLWFDELTGEYHSTIRRPEDAKLPTTRYGCTSIDESSRLELTDVIAGSSRVLNDLLNGHGYPSGEDGRQAIATLVACHLSADSDGSPVDVDSRLPLDRSFRWA